MRKTNRIILFLLATLLMGCAERLDEVGNDALTDFNLSVNLGTRTATDPNAVNAEEAIYSARLIVVGTVKGNENYQKVTCNQYFSAADISVDRIIRAKARTGVSDIYLIVNEGARITTDVSAPTKPLDNIATLGDLEKATLTFPASPIVGGRYIPMMRCFRGVDILFDQTTHIGGDFEGGRVERMWAKVRARFQSRDADPATGKLDLTGSVINSVELHSIPKHILLDEGQRYTDDLTAVDRLITKDYTLAKTIASDEQGYLFYLPEHILTSADRMSYLLVKGTIKGKERTYRIYLGNNDKPKGDFNITRNQFYDYTGTVCSMGDGEIEIVMDVQPWNVVNSNSSVGNYLKISNAEYIIFERPQLPLPYVPIATVGHNIAGTHTDVVSASGTGLSLQGTLDPNDSQGTNVFPDAANLPTSIDSKLAQKDIIVNMLPDFTSGTVKVDLGGQFHQDIKITRAPYQADGAYERYDLGTGFVFIPADANSEWMKISTATAWSSSMATVSGTISETAHLYVYIKRSVDSRDKGVGFNAVRQKDGSTEKFTVRCSYLLPQIGSLLIARRDLIGRKTWGNAMGRYMFENPNTTLVGPTMGGAFDGCNTLGSGWRIPTESELRSIHNKQKSIIAQVGGQFLADYFWTCTENNATSAKIIPFYGDATTRDHLKTGTLSMRCVKNL